MRVLVADDDAELRELILTVLNRIGMSDVDVAESGQEAWTKLSGGALPELLVLDLKMPGIYGTEICAKLRKTERGRETKIFILTSYLTPNVRQMVMESGADECMEKPFNPDHFARAIQKLMGLPVSS